MSLFTSTHFASTVATGKDWREAAKTVLEQLESIRTSGDEFNVGFLYISDHIAQDASSILNLFRSVLNIESWVGCIGIGVCACGQEYINEPAISAMIGRFDEADFCIFPPVSKDIGELSTTLGQWLSKTDPMMVLVHGTPTMQDNPSNILQALEQATNGFVCGGFSSSQTDHSQIANRVYNNDISGIAFSKDIKVATTFSQGCVPLGKSHTITHGDGQFIRSLDGERAIDVFEEEIRNLAKNLQEKDTKKNVVDKLFAASSGQEEPHEIQHILKGDVHIAFSDSQSDQDDYIVRNIINLDPEDGSLNVSRHVSPGETIRFVYRDNETIKQELCSSLVALRERVQKDTGAFEPKGALYISCIARAFDEMGEKQNGEMQLIQDIIGDVPLAGFYASGEVSNARLYSYTGVLILFL